MSVNDTLARPDYMWRHALRHEIDTERTESADEPSPAEESNGNEESSGDEDGAVARGQAAAGRDRQLQVSSRTVSNATSDVFAATRGERGVCTA